MHLKIAGKKTQVVSTIGAGDNFSAGIIYGLYQQLSSITTNKVLTSDHWAEIMNFGTHFASAVCGSSDNYIPEVIAKLLKSDNVHE